MDALIFTKVPTFATPEGVKTTNGNNPKGLKHYSLSGLVELINNTKQGTPKNQLPAILKGRFVGGHNGEHLKTGADYLFLDIDVHDNLNEVLKEPAINAKVRAVLNEISIFWGQSSSGLGSWALVNVYGFAQYNNATRDAHKIAAYNVYEQIERLIFERTGVNIELDRAQGKLRQIRYLKPQPQPIAINPNAPVFRCSINPFEVITKHQRQRERTAQTIKEYTDKIETNFDAVAGVGAFGSWFANNCKRIADLKGGIHNEVLSFANLAAAYVRGGCIEHGTAVQLIKAAAVAAYSNQHREPAATTEQTIIDGLAHGDGLKTLSAFLSEQQAYTELKHIGRHKKPNEVLTVNSFVSEAGDRLKQIFETNLNTLLVAPTGTGKTRFLVETFKDCLGVAFVVPYRSNVAEIAHKYGLCTITAERYTEPDKLCVMTYDQYAQYSEMFHTVITDEAHNLTLQTSFRHVLRQWDETTKGKKVINVTGTPLATDYTQNNYVVKIDVAGREPIRGGLFTYTKLKPEHIKNEVLKNHKQGTKTVVFIDNKDLIRAAGELLNGLTYSILTADETEHKEHLTTTGTYFNTDVIFCTSAIRDGVNVNDTNVGCVLTFLDQYDTHPAAVAQWLARSRNWQQIKYLVYRKSKRKDYFYRSDIDVYNRIRKNELARIRQLSYFYPISNERGYMGKECSFSIGDKLNESVIKAEAARQFANGLDTNFFIDEIKLYGVELVHTGELEKVESTFSQKQQNGLYIELIKADATIFCEVGGALAHHNSKLQKELQGIGLDAKGKGFNVQKWIRENGQTFDLLKDNKEAFLFVVGKIITLLYLLHDIAPMQIIGFLFKNNGRGLVLKDKGIINGCLAFIRCFNYLHQPQQTFDQRKETDAICAILDVYNEGGEWTKDEKRAQAFRSAVVQKTKYLPTCLMENGAVKMVGILDAAKGQKSKVYLTDILEWSFKFSEG